MGSATTDIRHVDAECPACYWPERIYIISTRMFGCIRCDYTSDERNA